MPAIEAREVAKRFGEVRALREISFTVEKGELYGLIGPDGGGKSTLFRILATLLLPDRGYVSVLGRDAVTDYRELRSLIGYMPGRFALYSDLSVAENLAFFASVFNTTVERGMKLIEPVYRQLEPFRDRLAGDLSGGMKQKLALCCALIHRPPLLLLDEPTTGVDALSRREFWTMLRQIREEGFTILVSTPYMDEATQCDRVALMREGTILRISTPGELTDRFERRIWSVTGGDRYRIIRRLRGYPEVSSVQPFGSSVHITAHRNLLDTPGLREYLEEEETATVRVEETDPSVEDVFISLMNRTEEGNDV